MISEHAFCARFSSFWRDTLPNLEAVLRATNLGYQRFAPPLRPKSLPGRRDVVGETGFRLYGLSVLDTRSPEELVGEAEDLALAFFDWDRRQLDNDEQAEALEICRRLSVYANENGSLSDFMPAFAGHGMMTSCQGDLVVGGDLVEVKYVDRWFRSTDLRQLLCYSALRYFDSKSTFQRVALVNPLRGTCSSIDLGQLVEAASGRSVGEFFQAFSYVLASGEVSR